MKASKYNYILENDEFSFWYNGAEHTFFRLPLNLGRKIKRMMEFPDAMKQINEPFYHQLIKKGFLVDDDADELAEIRERNEDSIKEKEYFLIILPTLNCNFKCWYCIQDHVPSRMSEDTMYNVKRHIDYMIEKEKIKSIHLEWFGGEPLMFFNKVIEPICTYIKHKCIECNVNYYASATTNGYYLTSGIIDKLIDLKFRSFQITLDGPKKLHDKVKYQANCSSAFVRVLENINNLLSLSENIKILLRINYTAQNLDYVIVDEINKIVSAENRHKITIMPKKVWQEKVDKGRFCDVKKLLHLFHDSGYGVSALDAVMNFIPCYANKKYYNAINYNGDVVKCTACNDLYESEGHGHLKSDGTISWSDNFLDKYKIKTYENGTCLKCKYLPMCMGRCPRDSQSPFYCKMDCMDNNIEESLIEYINYAYEK